MTARAPVYIDSGKLHVFEDGDTLPPWLSPSSMAWENLTGVPTSITELAALTGPGYAKLDAAGAWSISVPTKSDVGLSLVENTALSTWGGSANLATLGTVTTGVWHGTAIADAYISSAAAWNAKEGGLGNPSASGYLLSSTSAGVRSWVAPYSLPTATASVLGGVKVGTGLAISSGVLSVAYGTTAGTACVGNDSRLSDSRTPTAHALDGALHTISGKTAGQVLVATGATTFGFATISGDAALSGAGALTLATLLTAGSAGGATSVPTLTWDAKGRLTAAGSAAISIPHTQINDWSTATSGFQTSLGFTPVQQGGGTSMGGNKVYIGWGTTDNSLRLQIDTTNFGSTWPINISGIAGIASSVAWTNVTGRPTALSSFTNDSGYLTSNQSISLKGAVTGSGTTSIATSFANTHLAGINQDLTTTSSPMFAGLYTTGTYGSCGVFTGNADNAAYTAYNLKIKSWWGIGFESYDGVTRILMDTRTGGISTLGGINASGLITANGGISGNLTGHASLDIPLTGSSAITGALVSSSAATFADITANSDLHVNGMIYIGGGMVWGISNTLFIGSASDNIQIDMTNNVFTTSIPTHICATLTANQLYSTGDVVLDGKFRPAVNIQSAVSYTITSSDQGKMILSNGQLSLPESGIPTGFWCIVNWHVGGGGVKFGPTASGTTWILRGTYLTTGTSTPFTGIVSWDGYTWYAG